MRSATAWFLLLVLALVTAPTSSFAAAQAPDRVRINGCDYVRLGVWTQSRGFAVRWVKPQETLQLTSPLGRVILTIDSREARVNGLQVWLLDPLVARNGQIYIAAHDLQSTLQPLLWPPRNRSNGRIKTICLDPGHGGKDPGNRVGSNEEKKYVLLLAQEVRQQLARAGFKVVLTRSSDTFVDLPVRPDLARRHGADLFVSLHFNAAENGRDSVQGAEVYCLTPWGACSTNARGEGGDSNRCYGNRFDDRNLFLAYQMQKALLQNLQVEDRGVRRARFAVLRDAAMPAVLVEAGFMSHPVEGRKIFEPAYRRQIARAVVQGIQAYKRQVEPARR